MARVHIRQEVCLPEETTEDYQLCLQWVTFFYDNGDADDGYRFIWRRPGGNLQPARGQARIPSLEVARKLMQRADDQGWGQNRAFDADRLEKTNG